MAQKPHSLEYTRLLASDVVFHYTCNPPSKNILDEYGIKQIGVELGCKDAREILLIPSGVYEKFGYSTEGNLTVTSENLMRKMSRL